MKITGGSFGINGNANLYNGELQINGIKKSKYQSNQILRINTDSKKEKNFGIIGFIIGLIILPALFFYLIGFIGAIIAIAICIAGSFYNETTNSAEIIFMDGNTVKLKCSKSEINSLIKLKG